ncbi:MAG: bifunctional rhamnulose-1-phosphate aldolase/short-chain dehydrogenase [Akkermansiaceae bacterium]|jgi:rhamnulose-1-phosphate aldolase/alcohol dehydrogenase|nr:bifunctional rhamnulose-1-phosphate aldolase/short-chain dehydrogenase [Akkermansiaceae bacterium]MDP4646877.1 bifunctional rhamnulose-1-phosphate aldolase/short-chain dehydrogenase [Akkermansiaceae bacterium]MDP4781208.1 bifunctional rhamnulose-1-phosphate aldolase/short-chain dehydrogenase [Akkermansiaceae bacterium]MDP4847916.1 bifunctional rhamnulose-1-phosphate aldolase/short-chain dehydrogenase [Akkermansiaceae bacterium]MDP4899020.1 bifunctional rhamnulose-1-phosphate aldolase/short-c
MQTYKHVTYSWDDSHAATLDAVDLLVYRSNILGADQRITNTGGGNTSSKIMETDPLTGEQTEVLWVKGSGGDLRTSKRENFSSLYQEKLISLQSVYAGKANNGLKTPAEDEMVGMYSHTTFNLNPRPSSIDTPLHSFLSGKHVDHMHPNAIIAIAASKNCEELTKEIFEGEMEYVPWMRPGFELGLAMEAIEKEKPTTQAIMMGQHGFISWDNDAKKCYELTLRLIDKAAQFIEDKYEAKGGDAAAFGGQKYTTLPEEQRRATLAGILPWLRGQVSQQKRFIGTIQDDEKILRFVNSADAPRLAELGTSCPDHFLRTKIKPLYVAWDPQSEDAAALKEKLAAALVAYREDYAKYYETCKQANSPAMRDPNPTVVLIPGLGMISWGKDKSESRVTAEFYNCAVEVMRGAEAIDQYISLPQQEAFDIEYWLLEEAKLQRMPAEKELARQTVIVIGAGSGIGKETAHRLVKEGANIVCVDLNKDAAEATAKEITDQYGAGIGVAGSGISGCGPSIGLAGNITDRASIREMLDQVSLAYGGFDHICITAGIFVPSDTTGHIPDDKWALTFNINVTGSYLVADEAYKNWKEQGLKGNLVLTTSANAAVAKKGSLAYDTSKAAANHLTRELAIELAPLVRVNAVAPATVVKGSAMFPRERVIGSLAKYDIPYTDDEETESLVNKLAQFYADRTLTKSPITPGDQAEAYFVFVTDRLSKSTGQIITVDGGLHEAFLR